MDDNEEEFYTQSAERLKEIDEKQKNRIARSIENQAVRNSFTKKNEDKNDFYL
jgi:hypothetical protein